jgi:hypothetical protein
MVGKLDTLERKNFILYVGLFLPSFIPMLYLFI